MLAFMTTWIDYSSTAYVYLAQNLHKSVYSLNGNYLELQLWILYVGAVSVFTADDHQWLLPLLSQASEGLGLENWSAVGRHLHSLPWVNFIHDSAAQKLWERVTRSALQLNYSYPMKTLPTSHNRATGH
jgi:hypothetical protein